MEIKASDVKALREKTGAGMMECKKALQECNGDAKEAEKYLKEKGLAAVEKRASRATSEGIIVVKTADSKAVMAELTCETDFVAKNADFIAVGDKIAETALAKGYTDVQQELSDMVLDLATRVRENMGLRRLTAVQAGSDEYIAHYVHSDKKTGVIVMLKSDNSAVFTDKAFQEFAYDCCLHAAAFTPLYVKKEDVELQKPDNVKEGIVKGKLNKHLAEICFLEQAFVKDDKVSVAAKMKEVGKQLGANISLSKLVLWQLGQ